jgi:hypothetical protein
MSEGRPVRRRRRDRLVEERHREITQIEQPGLDALPLPQVLQDPPGRLFGEPALPGTSDDR